MKFNWGMYVIFIVAFTSPSILTSLPVPAADKHIHSMVLARRWAVPGSSRHDSLHSGQRVQSFNHQTREFGSHGLRVFQVPVGKLQIGFNMPFTVEWFPCGSTMQVWFEEEMVVLESSSLSTDAGALWEWPLGCWSPPSPRPFHHSDSLSGQFSEESWWTSSIYRWWRLLCSLGPSTLHKFFCTLHQICASIQYHLRVQQTLPWILGLVWDMHRRCGTSHRQIDSSCRNIW